MSRDASSTAIEGQNDTKKSGRRRRDSDDSHAAAEEIGDKLRSRKSQPKPAEAGKK